MGKYFYDMDRKGHVLWLSQLYVPSLLPVFLFFMLVFITDILLCSSGSRMGNLGEKRCRNLTWQSVTLLTSFLTVGTFEKLLLFHLDFFIAAHHVFSWKLPFPLDPQYLVFAFHWTGDGGLTCGGGSLSLVFPGSLDLAEVLNTVLIPLWPFPVVWSHPVCLSVWPFSLSPAQSLCYSTTLLRTSPHPCRHPHLTPCLPSSWHIDQSLLVLQTMAQSRLDGVLMASSLVNFTWL